MGHGDILSHLVTMLDFVIHCISVNLVISVYFVFLSQYCLLYKCMFFWKSSNVNTFHAFINTFNKSGKTNFVSICKRPKFVGCK